MRSVGGILTSFAAGTIGLALLGCATPNPSGGEVRRGLLYKSELCNWGRLDVYYPDRAAPVGGFPMIVWLHGGGWVVGNRETDPWLNGLTRRGFAVVSLDYRNSLHAKFPAQIVDVTDGVRWVVANADRLELDAGRMGMGGASAGAHLALLAAMSRGSEAVPWALGAGERVRAVCAFYPPTSLVTVIPPDSRDRFNNLVALLLGGTVEEKLELARSGSPIRYVEAGDPPTFLLHGGKDEVVPVEQSRTMRAALDAAGVPVTLREFPEEGHGFAPDAKTLAEIGEFFGRWL